MKSVSKKLTNLICPCLIICLTILSGCATQEPIQKQETVFYPPAPLPPRIQFLASYTGIEDIEPEGSQFDAFLTGQKAETVRLGKPYGVAVIDGKIYTCDTNSTVWIFDLPNKKLRTLEGAKGLGKVLQPQNISIQADGMKYVADPIRGKILAYNSEDFYVKAYTYRGQWKPVDAVPFGDLLYVADAENADIKVFNINSTKLVKIFGNKGEPEEKVFIPTNIDIDEHGIIYVSDAGRFQVVKYDRDGHYLGKVGAPGQNAGFFARPRGVAVDRTGRIFVADAAFDNVQIFSNEGQLLTFFGGFGFGPGKLYLPSDVTIDYDNIEHFQQYIDPNFEVEYLVFVVNQFGHRLVSVFGFGKEKGRKYQTDEELREETTRKLEESGELFTDEKEGLEENPDKEKNE